VTLRHVGDDLYALLSGDLSNREMVAVNDHLKDCESCRQELVDVSVTHALLGSVSELLAPELSEARRAREPELPPLGFL